jgi:hypothetical protein
MPDILPSMQINVQYIRHEVHKVVRRIPVRPACAELPSSITRTRNVMVIADGVNAAGSAMSGTRRKLRFSRRVAAARGDATFLFG